MVARTENLEYISPQKISRNKDNPRMIFREKELLELLTSIENVGIQVPITLYKNGSRFTLVDGERRWRCAKKLNLKTMPAIILPKPSPLNNLLMMFNIHNVRVDWDIMPMAYKLEEIRELLKQKKKPHGPNDLAGVTGVPLSTVKRAQDLLRLPKKYQKMLMEEAKKPRDQQKVKADLFIEIIKSQNAIQRYIPEIFNKISHRQYLDSMVQKYKSGTVDNVVKFREVSKIARGERAGVDKEVVKPVIEELITNKSYKISEAYEDTVSNSYQARDLNSKIDGLIKLMRAIKSSEELPPELKKSLRGLSEEINRILGR